MTRRSADGKLLRAISRVHALRVSGADPLFLFDELLGQLLILTESEYGFLGEVIYTPDGEGHLKTQSITHTTWHEQTRDTYVRHPAGGGEPETLPLLFRSAIASGKPVTAQAFRINAERSSPAVQKVLGLPLHHGDRLVGLVGLANRDAGYDDDLLQYLQPLLAACATVIEAHQIEQRRLRAQVALQRSEQNFRSVTENALDLVSVMLGDGTLQYTSPSHQRVLGYAQEDLVGQNFFAFVHPDDLPKGLNASDLSQLSSEDSPFVEFRFRHKDGSWRFLEGIGHQLAEGAAATGIVVHARDITERKRDAAELKQTLSVLSATLQSTADGLLVVDRRGRIVNFNRKFAEMWQLPDPVLASGEHSQVLAIALNRLCDPESARAKLKALDEQPDTESYDVLELRDGRVFERYSQPQRIAGVSVGRVFSFRDITERRRAEDAEKTEAQISATLARVGQEMIASLSTPEILDRMCQLTTEALDCDLTRTFLRRAETRVYVPVASYGDTLEQWKALRALQLPQESVAPLVALLERKAVVNLKTAEGLSGPPAAEAPNTGTACALGVPLRRGEELIGFLVAGYRRQQQSFTRQQERIGEGIAQLASLALENARLFEELENANRLRADFVAAMSHELRTPLHIIMGYTELLLEGEFGNLTPEQVNRLQRLAESATALLDLIRATMDISRLEGGRVPLEIEEIDLAALIDELDTERRELPGKPTVTFSWHVPADLPTLRSDPTKLRVVLKNLISNALKYTEEGSVEVSVGEKDGGLLFSVIDTGIGMEPDAQAAIFEPFQRAENSRLGGYGGAGLGLYIVRRLLGMLTGTISVESDLGRGSTFSVWIPLDLNG